MTLRRFDGYRPNTAFDDLPATVPAELKKDPDIAILPLHDWWIRIATPNTAAPPTDNLMFRRAVRAALDMDEIMQAASDGEYRLDVSFKCPDQPAWSDAGKETYNIKDLVLAKKLLAESGYGGEPVILAVYLGGRRARLDDPDVLAAWHDMNTLPDRRTGARRSRACRRSCSTSCMRSRSAP